jgi:RecQ-mediated genome instability protein 1
VVEEHNLHPATDMGRIKEHVESQLLMSDLTDSMIHGSGLPHNLAGLQKGSLSGPPVLVQIMALTEIGHSAFSLVNVRQTKIDRADFSGLTRGDNEEEADEGPVPNYPRSMLQFELSDGAVKLNAIEYRKIPQLDLENTPLGFKVRFPLAGETALLKASVAKSLDTTQGRDHQKWHRVPRAKKHRS